MIASYHLFLRLQNDKDELSRLNTLFKHSDLRNVEGKAYL